MTGEVSRCMMQAMARLVLAALVPLLVLGSLPARLLGGAQAAPGRDPGCPGGRYVTTVEAVQHQNWIQASPTVYESTTRMLRLPRWLGSLAVIHASQGYLLSGEERIGQWTRVTVPPTLTVRLRAFDRSYYWGLRLPVARDFRACRDESGNLYVR